MPKHIPRSLAKQSLGHDHRCHQKKTKVVSPLGNPETYCHHQTGGKFCGTGPSVRWTPAMGQGAGLLRWEAAAPAPCALLFSARQALLWEALTQLLVTAVNKKTINSLKLWVHIPSLPGTFFQKGKWNFWQYLRDLPEDHSDAFSPSWEGLSGSVNEKQTQLSGGLDRTT